MSVGRTRTVNRAPGRYNQQIGVSAHRTPAADEIKKRGAAQSQTDNAAQVTKEAKDMIRFLRWLFQDFIPTPRPPADPIIDRESLRHAIADQYAEMDQAYSRLMREVDLTGPLNEADQAKVDAVEFQMTAAWLRRMKGQMQRMDELNGR